MNLRKRRYLMISLIFILNSFMLMGESVNAKTEQKFLAAKVECYANEVDDVDLSTITKDLMRCTANVSPVSEFFDSSGNYNTIYESMERVTLVKYTKDLSSIKTYSIEKPYPLYGGAISDAKGNYYIVYGQAQESMDSDNIVIRVVKYNSDFKYLAEVTFTGIDTCTYPGTTSGTMIPFWGGNCDIAINGNVLVCNYARLMFNMHQSNHVIFVDIDSMTKVDQAGSYTSHSFDQRVIATESGDFLFVNQGDAYPRGFNISYSKRGRKDVWGGSVDYVSFHFREGVNRDLGYNETYAQLGGIAEIDTGFVLAGASEKTLSLDLAPTSRTYFGNSEARNLFIQIINKNFVSLTGESAQVLKTEVRKATGTTPTSADTDLYLKGNEIDYGVLWLTDYSDEYCVVNPKLIVTEDDRIVLLWEKFKYETENEKDQYIDSYYMILSKKAEILQKETSLHGIRLTENETPVYRDNKVYFSTLDKDRNQLILNELYLGKTIYLTDITSFTYNNIKNQNYTGDSVEPEVVIELNNRKLREGIDYELSYKDNIASGKATITVKGIRGYFGEKDIHFYIKPIAPVFYSLNSYYEGIFHYGAACNIWYDNHGVEVVYSTNKNFTNKKMVTKGSGSISNLKSNKTYYVKARIYISVDGVRIYSNYSKVYKVKVK